MKIKESGKIIFIEKTKSDTVAWLQDQLYKLMDPPLEPENKEETEKEREKQEEIDRLKQQQEEIVKHLKKLTVTDTAPAV